MIPQHFGNDLKMTDGSQLQLIADASDPNVANTLVNYAQAVIGDFEKEVSGERVIPYTIVTETKMMYNPQLKGAYNFVPGVMAMVLLLVCTMMTALTVVREKELGTMEIMLVSPIRPIKIILAKAVPYLLRSIFNIATRNHTRVRVGSIGRVNSAIDSWCESQPSGHLASTALKGAGTE